jgi:hypothetical protein
MLWWDFDGISMWEEMWFEGAGQCGDDDDDDG